MLPAGHCLHLFIPDERESWEYGLTSVEMGFTPLHWRHRLRVAWRVLRGKDAPMAEVILNRADVAGLRAALGEVLAVGDSYPLTSRHGS